jgi:hypothetical protein
MLMQKCRDIEIYFNLLGDFPDKMLHIPNEIIFDQQ